MNNKNKFLSYKEAKEFVHKLNLKTMREWLNYSHKIKKDNDLPLYPNKNYKNKGWISWQDFLGNGKTIVSTNRNFISFEEARNFVHTLNLKTVEEWKKYCKSTNYSDNIPVTPLKVYKNKGWVSWRDFLGNKKISNYEKNKFFLPYEEVKKIVHKLNLKNIYEWREYCKSGNKPDNIPSSPDKTYKNKGWISTPDFLGTKPKFTGEFLSFKEVRKFVHKLNLNSEKDWKKYCKSGNKPNNIPFTPYQVYKDKGWISYPDFLGTKIGFTGKFLPFEEAKNFAHKLKLNSSTEWFNYSKTNKKPVNIPAHPSDIYKNKGWTCWSDWLGKSKTGNEKNKIFFSFEEAREFVHTLNLNSIKDWMIYAKSNKKPYNIPHSPQVTYRKNGWISWSNWLGYEKTIFLSFEEAREFVHKLNLKIFDEWREYSKSGKRPKNIPGNPSMFYKNKGWKSLGDWLGTGKNMKVFQNSAMPYEEAKKFVHKLNLKSEKEWREYCKSGNKPDNIPSSPYQVYRDKGWISYSDFLGNERAFFCKKMLTFDELKIIVKNNNIKTKKQYDELYKKYRENNIAI